MGVKKQKHILVLVESLDVNDSSGTKGRVALLQNMVAAGFKVTALHYTQKEIALSGIRTVMVKEGNSRFYFLSRLQRYFYKWFKINIGNVYEARSGFSFNWQSATYAFAKALKSYNPQEYDMIWTLGKGTQFRAHAAVLSQPKWHGKWHAYVHDPYPQQLYPRPYNFVPLGFKQKRSFFRSVTQQAHKMIFPSVLLKEWMQSYFKDIENKSLIIPHQIADTTSSKRKLPDYFKQEYFTLLHAGNLLDLRDPWPLLTAYQNFKSQNPAAQSQLLFIGKHGQFSGILELAKKEEPSIYISKDYIPFEEVYAMQQQASVNIVLEARGEISPFLPGKVPHCLAANSPILLISPYYSETKRILGKDYPYVHDFDEVAEIKESINILYQQWVKDKNLKLDRPDLAHYMSAAYLKEKLS